MFYLFTQFKKLQLFNLKRWNKGNFYPLILCKGYSLKLNADPSWKERVNWQNICSPFLKSKGELKKLQNFHWIIPIYQKRQGLRYFFAKDHVIVSSKQLNTILKGLNDCPLKLKRGLDHNERERNIQSFYPGGLAIANALFWGGKDGVELPNYYATAANPMTVAKVEVAERKFNGSWPDILEWNEKFYLKRILNNKAKCKN